METLRGERSWYQDEAGLQFGHACLRVETQSFDFRPRTHHSASIRPRLLARGDDDVRQAFTPGKRRLQFGHACLRVETLSISVPARFTNWLQFGHACLRVETPLVRLAPSVLIGLQFGHACLRVETIIPHGSDVGCGAASIRPRLLARGDFHPIFRYAFDGSGFNSATPACAWRPDERSSWILYLRALQFGHACLRVETRLRIA